MIEYDSSNNDIDELIKTSPIQALSKGLNREWLGHNTLYSRALYIIKKLEEQLEKEKAKNEIQ